MDNSRFWWDSRGIPEDTDPPEFQAAPMHGNYVQFFAIWYDEFHDLDAWLAQRESRRSQQLTAKERRHIEKSYVLDHGKYFLHDFGLRAVSQMLNRIGFYLRDPKAQARRVRTMLRELGDWLRSDADDSELFVIKPERVMLVIEPLGGWEKTAKKFPRTKPDVHEASYCLALERHTACVFHLMRVMEIGVQKFAKRLSTSIDIEKPWGVIIAQIRGQIGGLPTGTPTQRSRRDKFSVLANHLSYVANKWRNPTMHPKRSYSETEASEIHQAVQQFMEFFSAQV